ncbi:cytochrome c3 family protein [Trichloromonas sp.]|uniref:cytochrome c3 family protein n=1 Tax=Trichloromonas sp. TaxID=3069249 RepID=UPI002A3F44F7|nr:cytochrome c3 family protein [Trichloromonas sp.]
MKRWLVLFAGIVSVLLLTVPPLMAEGWESCPETVIFPGRGKLGSVKFSPKLHKEAGVTCLLCHHTGTEDGKCSNCHDGKDPKVPNSQDAYHLLCKGCHKYKHIDNSCEFCHKPGT